MGQIGNDPVGGRFRGVGAAEAAREATNLPLLVVDAAPGFESAAAVLGVVEA
jgi:hypothetical protein